MDRDVGVAQVRHPRAKALGGASRQRDDNVRGSGAAEQLVDMIDPTEYGHGIGLRMDRELAPSEKAAGAAAGVAGVDEADDRQGGPRPVAQASRQPTAIASRPEVRRSRAQSSERPNRSNMFTKMSQSPGNVRPRGRRRPLGSDR